MGLEIFVDGKYFDDLSSASAYWDFIKAVEAKAKEFPILKKFTYEGELEKKGDNFKEIREELTRFKDKRFKRIPAILIGAFGNAKKEVSVV